MGKGLHKYTRGKGNRWKKGDSSSSNPETKTHRDAARRGFFQYKIAQEQESNVSNGLSNLSLAADDMDTSDSKSLSSLASSKLSQRSDISAWTQCSIQSFRRLQTIWSNNSVLHREMLAILAAVTEIIKEKKGKETETEYFAALMATLDTVESKESLTAVLSLISLLIKRVPSPVLKKQTAQILAPLVKILTEHVSSENNSLLRSVMKCLTYVLRVQDLASWKTSSIATVFRMILSVMNHHKPRVRKQCQSSICSILKGSDIMTTPNPPPVHPVATVTAEFCIQSIEETNISKDSGVTLHILGLLKDVLADFPASALKASAEAVLNCMVLADPIMTTVALKALNGLFMAAPPSSRLDFLLNVQIINALYDFQPAADDTNLTPPWLETIKHAHINLCRLDEEGIHHLPKLSKVCMTIMSSSVASLRNASADVLKEIINGPVKDVSAKKEVYAKFITVFQKFFLNLESGLSYQYHAAWSPVLRLISAFYEVCGSHGSNYMAESLVKIAELRDGSNFAEVADLDYAFGRAIRRIGPPKVLKKVPLDFKITQTPMDLSRSWVIPLLRDNVQDTYLGYFVKEILPMAIQLRTKSSMLSAAGENAEAKACDLLSAQIWSLLPGFCTRPVDLLERFKDVAQPLGETLLKRPELRLEIMAALRNLVAKSLDNAPYCEELSKYSRNFIPILLNLYTDENSSNEGIRLAALETLKVWLKITPKDYVEEIMNMVSGKLTEKETSNAGQQACLDIVAALLPHIPDAKIDGILEFCRGSWTSKDHTLQKKAYRLLEELLSSENQRMVAYVGEKLADLKKSLLECGTASRSPSKPARLRCIADIIKKNGKTDLEWIKAVFPEIVMATKEVSEKARHTAFETIKQIGELMIESGKLEDIMQFFEWILSGFAGSPEGISASLLALSHSVFLFHQKLPQELIDLLVENMIILMGSKSREIIQSVLGFLKVAITKIEDVKMGKHLAAIIKAFSELDENSRRSFRIKIKELFLVMIKQFGYSLVVELVPEDDHKLLNNIRKTEDRKKRKKKEKREIKDDSVKRNGAESISGKSRAETVADILDELASSDDEAEEEMQPKRKSKLFIKEDDDEDIVDFTDPKVAQKISSTQPAIKKKKSDNLIIGPDGRIIIPEAMETDRMSVGSRKTTGSKKKMERDADQDLDDEDAESGFQYKSGGSGIHRDLKAGKEKKRKVQTGEEFKAKKAGGDIKKKGRPDPYAYIPLDRKAMNKRKRAKLSGQFTGIIKKAQKGAQKGSKMKARKHGLKA